MFSNISDAAISEAEAEPPLPEIENLESETENETA
jgi:hypothetical protein